jgi:two-component system response regulator PilR (NtrC family)
LSPAPQAPTRDAARPAAGHRLLVVDDEPDLRTLYELTLVREGYEVESAGSVEEAWPLLLAGDFQLVITDMRLPDGTGLDLLRRMDEAGRPEKGIVITAYGSAENAVEALKAGAYDYLTKPVDLRQFRAAVASALGRVPAELGPRRAAAAPAAGGRASGAAATRERHGDAGNGGSAAQRALQRLVGESLAMQQVRQLVEKVARSMAPVLVEGESGTGKELVARAIHEVSPRGALPFVAVNCGAIPEALLEAEFFGYRKGAFTGAADDRDGFFQAAQGGTLFLDEIGDLPLAMQSKLLRVIQERAVRPIGATAETPVNVRIVSATHKDLGSEVQAGRFRQDLYYRLNVIRIGIPPLRERLRDLPLICAAVLERITRDAGVSPQPLLSAAAQQRLLSYTFPGNVRELENLLHRAVALSSGVDIDVDELGLPDLPPAEARLPADAPGAAEAAAVVAARRRDDAPPGEGGAGAAGNALRPLPSDLARHLDDVERDILERALERHRYNRTAAGASLGLSLRQMRYRMARLGVGSGLVDGAAERGEPD